jgi:hypothetical protein
MGRPIHCEFLLPWESTTLLTELKTLERTKPLRIRGLAADSGRKIAAIGEDSLTVGQLLDFVKAPPAPAPQGFQRDKLAGCRLAVFNSAAIRTICSPPSPGRSASLRKRSCSRLWAA